MIAFNHETYSPSSKPDTRTDTIWRDSLHIDALRQVPYTHFLPDDVTLLAFMHPQTDRYLLKTERLEPNKLSFYFTYGDSILPEIKGLNFNADSAFVIEANEKRDTIHYWLRDTMLINKDTLLMDISYHMTDTLGNLVLNTDSAVEMLPKVPYEKRLKEQTKEMEKWQKQQEKKKKNDQPYDSIYPVKPLEVKYNVPSSATPDSRITVEMPTPLAVCDTSKVHLYSMIDSVWYQAPCEFRQIANSVRQYELLVDWRLETEYSFEVDSAAFIDIYGVVSKANKQGIKVKGPDDFSLLVINVSGLEVADTSIIVQLLNNSDSPVMEVRVKDGKARFEYLMPGKYYMRAFVDANGNGVWDTGDYAADRQAEAVYYYSQEIECKEKWDVTKSWNLTEVPRFRQKPAAITKQKPDQEKKLKNRNVERAKQLGKEYLKTKGVKL